MPFVHVKSLPIGGGFDAGNAVEGICRDVAAAAALDPRHVHVTWEYFAPGHYAAGGVAPNRQPETSHPVLVEFVLPDFFSAAAVSKMLGAVAASVAQRAGLPIGNVFVRHRAAASGSVFDGGEVVRWPMSRATADPN